MSANTESPASEVVLAALRQVVEKKDLTKDQAEAVMNEILSGGASTTAIAALLTALRMKGETVEELTGFATVMRAKAAHVRPKLTVEEAIADTGRDALVDTCGTGGDASGTFNISTAAAFVVAGCGVRVAKHGNRSISSRCGSADVLEALGVNLGLSPDGIARCIEEVGIGFLFAPALHPAMKFAMPARRELKIRTVFNLLGPLSNPAGASAQVVGVYDAKLTGMIARVLAALGLKRGFVVHGSDGLDEITNTGETSIAEIVNGSVKEWTLRPEAVGIARCQLSDLQGGDVNENVRIIREILEGKLGPKRDIVLMNAAAALVAAGHASDMKDGILLAAQSIDSGAAKRKLEALVEASRKYS
ncbi:MAG: anthranilate phosphoribosyltransferase [Acidobacteria bacterium RIFCSPLOWO2_12_FULL_54_10]|nr:MAG: anthranilate phosphoribosyltransferase [Acidobacteria bacterium RIFCSPLOWO2_12_FULL_54_10]